MSMQMAPLLFAKLIFMRDEMLPLPTQGHVKDIHGHYDPLTDADVVPTIEFDYKDCPRVAKRVMCPLELPPFEIYTLLLRNMAPPTSSLTSKIRERYQPRDTMYVLMSLASIDLLPPPPNSNDPGTTHTWRDLMPLDAKLVTLPVTGQTDTLLQPDRKEGVVMVPRWYLVPVGWTGDGPGKDKLVIDDETLKDADIIALEDPNDDRLKRLGATIDAPTPSSPLRRNLDGGPAQPIPLLRRNPMRDFEDMWHDILQTDYYTSQVPTQPVPAESYPAYGMYVIIHGMSREEVAYQAMLPRTLKPKRTISEFGPVSTS